MNNKAKHEAGRTAIPCLDCKDTHKCGIKCESMCCFDERCGCTATEIIPGLYRCDVCNLVVCREDDSFQEHLVEMTEWYDAFYSKNKRYLNRLEQDVLLGKTLNERDKAIYDAVDAFCYAKSNFSFSIPYTTRLDTMLHRENALTLIQAFETIKKVQF